MRKGNSQRKLTKALRCCLEASDAQVSRVPRIRSDALHDSLNNTMHHVEANCARMSALVLYSPDALQVVSETRGYGVKVQAAMQARRHCNHQSAPASSEWPCERRSSSDADVDQRSRDCNPRLLVASTGELEAAGTAPSASCQRHYWLGATGAMARLAAVHGGPVRHTFVAPPHTVDLARRIS